MENIYIICIEDQREVLNTIASDLSIFEDDLIIEMCESADEAEEVLDDIDAEGDYAAVIVSDHVMPGKSGVDFLIEVNHDPRFKVAKKLLLTGLATHQDTINAINNADIDRFIEKPWDSEVLIQYVKILLTEFIFEKGLNYRDYIDYLDQPTIYKKLKQMT